MARKESSLRKYLDRRVFSRLRVLIILAVLFVVVTIYEVVLNGFDLLLALSSIIFGLFIGIIVSRMYHLSWDSETLQVVSNMDFIGAIIFICYIIFMVVRSVVVGYWVHGDTYFGVIFSITAGVMIGRIAGTRHTLIKIKEDLREIRKSLI